MAVTDHPRVLVLGTSTPPPGGGSGSPQDTWQPLTAAKKDLEKLQSEITATQAKAKEDIAQSQRALTEAGTKQAQAAAQIAPLHKLLTDLEANSAAVAKLRDAAVAQLSSAEHSLDTVRKQVEKTLPPARRKAIEAAIVSVENKIADLGKRVEELSARATTGEAEVIEVQKRAAEGSLGGGLTQLLQLPRQLQAARAQLGGVIAAAEAAAGQGRMGEALYLAGELKRAIDSVRALGAQDIEIRDVKEVVTQWQAVQAAKSELSKKTGVLDGVKRELAEAERELEVRRQQRDRDIRAAIAPAEQPTPKLRAPQKAAVRPTSEKSRGVPISRR